MFIISTIKHLLDIDAYIYSLTIDGRNNLPEHMTEAGYRVKRKEFVSDLTELLFFFFRCYRYGALIYAGMSIYRFYENNYIKQVTTPKPTYIICS